MTDSTTEQQRLLSNPIPDVTISNNLSTSEISTARNYGSIQSPQDNSQSEVMDDSKTTLKFFEKVGFSLGHVYNDLCAVNKTTKI